MELYLKIFIYLNVVGLFFACSLPKEELNDSYKKSKIINLTPRIDSLFQGGKIKRYHTDNFFLIDKERDTLLLQWGAYLGSTYVSYLNDSTFEIHGVGVLDLGKKTEQPFVLYAKRLNIIEQKYYKMEDLPLKDFLPICPNYNIHETYQNLLTNWQKLNSDEKNTKQNEYINRLIRICNDLCICSLHGCDSCSSLLTKTSQELPDLYGIDISNNFHVLMMNRKVPYQEPPNWRNLFFRKNAITFDSMIFHQELLPPIQK